MAQTKFKGSMLDTSSPIPLTGLNIAGASALTAPAVADRIPIYDASGTVNLYITLSDLWKVINLFTAETAPAVDDYLALYDTSGSATDRIALSDLFKIINSFTEDTAPVGADYLATYDSSASAVKKILLSRLGIIDVAATWTKPQRGGVGTLTSSAASIASDFATYQNWAHTTTENTTLANPSNLTAGQAGFIVITQGATARTMAFGSYWKFPSATAPSLTASASAVDILAYYVESSTRISANLLSNMG